MPLLAERITRQRAALRRRRGADRTGRRRRRVLTWPAGAAGSTPARLVGLLADDDRRRVVAAADARGAPASTPSSRATGLPRRARQPGPRPAGRRRAGGRRQRRHAGRRSARRSSGRPARRWRGRRSDEHADEPGERRKVLDAFVRDGRITSIPAARAKRLVVLDWLAQDFEPGRALQRARGQRDPRAPPCRHRHAAPVPRRRGPARPGRRRVLAHRRHGRADGGR